MNNPVKCLVWPGASWSHSPVAPATPAGTGENAPNLPAASGGAAADTTPAQQQTNERGFIVKQLGEMACFGGAGENCEGGVSFALDKVEVDPQCGEFGSHPENGHTLLLHLRIATGSDAKVVDQVGGVINPFSFVEIGKDGVTRDTSFGMCADPSTNKLPDSSCSAGWRSVSVS